MLIHIKVKSTPLLRSQEAASRFRVLQPEALCHVLGFLATSNTRDLQSMLECDNLLERIDYVGHLVDHKLEAVSVAAEVSERVRPADCGFNL